MEKRDQKIVKNFFPLPAFFLICFFWVGSCSHVGQEVVIFSPAGKCPAYQENDWKAQVGSIDSRTLTEELQCRLIFLRSTADPLFLEDHFPSRISFLLAERETDPTIQERLAAEGVLWAERAISYGARGDGRVYYYWAVNQGLVIRNHPTLALKKIKLMAERLEVANQKVPSEDWGGPGRVLGLVYLKAPPWPQDIGDCDKALVLLKQTAERFPQHPLNHLFFAQALWDVNESESMEDIRRELEETRELLKEERWGFARKVWAKELEEFEKKIPDSFSVSR